MISAKILLKLKMYLESESIKYKREGDKLPLFKVKTKDLTV